MFEYFRISRGYCGAHNQPRFRLIPDGHMVHVKFTIIDADHHLEDWTFLANDKSETTRFDFHRKAASL